LNRLDPVSGQLVAPSGPAAGAAFLRAAGWGLVAGCPLAAAVLGAALEGNPTDAAARAASLVPLLLLGVDGWGLGIALFRQSSRTPLRVPVRTPAILAGVHFLAWLWASHLASFGGLYRLEDLGGGAGAYVVDRGSGTLLGLLAVGSLAVAVLLARTVAWVLISEQTAAPPRSADAEVRDEPDAPLGPEHVYEAQMLLNNLGYPVGPIDGALGEATAQALRGFQKRAGLKQTGQVTVLTMIELRNQWATRDTPRPGRTVLAVSGHLYRRLMERLMAWRRSGGT
jgi:hypothetical protein